MSRPDLSTLPPTHAADKVVSHECTRRGWGHDIAPRKTLEVKDARCSLQQPNQDERWVNFLKGSRAEGLEVLRVSGGQGCLRQILAVTTQAPARRVLSS